MDFGSAFAALGPVLGGLGGLAANIFMQRDQNELARGMSRDQMNFQEYHSTHAHQIEVEDLKQAGLNPILSAGGGGAPQPSGAQANLQEAPQIDLPAIIAMTTSLDQSQQKINIDKANSAAAIAKSLDDRDLTRAKKILAQKGMIKAELEGETAQVMRNMINFMKKGFSNPKVPKMPGPMESSRNKSMP